MTPIANISDSTFEEEVLRSARPVLVDFWAPWCAPCHVMLPVIDEIAKSFGDKVKVAKVNVDENPVTPQKYGIRGIPTLIFFSQGKVEETLVGVQPKEKIIEIINRLI
ncbi:MAG: thioredoxin [Candidatus Aminicenantales bacterium]